MAEINPDAQLPSRHDSIKQSDTGGTASQLLPQSAAGFASSNAPARSRPTGAPLLHSDPLALLQLRISELFFSLQGETSRIGLPTVFIRLTGCPLRCNYCDTAYAFSGGQSITLAEILRQVAQYKPQYVCVTGGEPLAQRNCLALLTALCDAGYQVSLETSGALDISAVDARVMRVVDIKTPASGEVEKNRWENLDKLTPHDEIKFVLCDESDYDWAREILVQHRLADKCTVLFSPAQGTLSAMHLADWVLRDRLPVRFQLQLHKMLWNNAAGH